jgi:hypothetical protein
MLELISKTVVLVPLSLIPLKNIFSQSNCSCLSEGGDEEFRLHAGTGILMNQGVKEVLGSVLASEMCHHMA